MIENLAPYLKPREGVSITGPITPAHLMSKGQADHLSDWRDYLTEKDQTAALHRLTDHLPRW